MKSHISLIFATVMMLAASVAQGADSSLVRFYSPGKAFSILLPANWKQADKDTLFAVMSPDENISVNGSAYRKANSKLEDFATSRWTVISEKFPFYKMTKKPYDLRSLLVNAVAAEYEGFWPGDKTPTVYVVVCAQSGDKSISLAFTMTKQAFLANPELIRKIPLSLQFEVP